MNNRTIVIFSTSLILLGVSSLLAIAVGSVIISPVKVLLALFSPEQANVMDVRIINNMRVTRVIASAFGGAALALAGLLLQILFNNPIADPYVLGISSGGRLFVGIALLGGLTFGINMTNPWFMFLNAFLGATLVMMVMLLFSAQLSNATTLLIIGIMLGYLCSAIIGVLVAFSDEYALSDFTKWSMGTFGLMTWPKIQVLAIVCSILFVLSFLQSKNLNALLLGESYAKSMGVNTRLMRVCIILYSGILTAVVTAFAGLIAFVGMSVPHMARLLFKTDDARVLIPAAILFGSILGVACDLVARTIAAPNELMISTVTSFVGVPIVIFLLMKRRKVMA